MSGEKPDEEARRTILAAVEIMVEVAKADGRPELEVLWDEATLLGPDKRLVSDLSDALMKLINRRGGVVISRVRGSVRQALFEELAKPPEAEAAETPANQNETGDNPDHDV